MKAGLRGHLGVILTVAVLLALSVGMLVWGLAVPQHTQSTCDPTVSVCP